MHSKRHLTLALGLMAAAAIACGGASEEFVIVTSDVTTAEPQLEATVPPTDSSSGESDKGTERGGLGGGSGDVIPTPNLDPSNVNPDAGPSTLVGSYTVSGTNPAESTGYIGTATISGVGDFFIISWLIDDAVTEGQGIFLNRTFSVAYPLSGCSVSAYNVAEDGSLDGLWVLEGEGTSPERADPLPNTPVVGLPFEYQVTGTNPDGTTYGGNMTLTPGTDDRAYLFRQIFTENNETVEFRGVSVLNADVLAASYANSGDCGVVNYTVNADGTLTALWTDTVVGISSGLGTETLTPGTGGDALN